MTTPALVFENVSKVYDTGRTHGSLVGGLGSLVGRARRVKENKSALNHVSFEVPAGEAFAIIGDNGAGKTTALRIATRLVHPTAGTVRIRGRVGALIEVGTGLHPDLTGRENVDLFGRILGIPRQVLSANYDAIVDFAEVGAAIEQPVKQYSSGMQLRLGFAIAAHLEPDVLIVDEAIAVGDVGFQRKCMERMAQLVRDGRTLIFVSHDLLAIETLCRRAIQLDRGRVVADGAASEVVAGYLAAADARLRASAMGIGEAGSGPLAVTGVSLHDANGAELSAVDGDDGVVLRIHYRTTEPIQRPMFSVGITEGHQNPLFLASMAADGQTPAVIDGMGTLDCAVRNLPLTPNTYDVWLSVLTSAGSALIEWQRIRRFEVSGSHRGPGVAAASVRRLAPIALPYQWSAPAPEGEIGPPSGLTRPTA